METFLSHVMQLVDPVFENLYGAENKPANVYYIPAGETGFSPCTSPDGNGNAPYDSQAYYYCGADRSIYIGQDSLWRYYNIGDAAPAMAYAHEWGHHLQVVMQIPAPTTLTEGVDRENQADCVAGAWIYSAEMSKVLEYPDDLVDVGGILREIAADENDVKRTHGTIQERSIAVNHGYNNGLRGCNDYALASPIYKG
ncbi:neutral zinc metallopeptidase [Kocuria sp. CPCC 205315]